MLAKRVFTVASLALLTACGGGGDTGPVNTSVDGSWQGSVSNVTGNGVTCNMTGVQLNLSQSGTTFSGNYTITHLTCVGPGGTQNGGPFSGSVMNGTISSGHVEFDMDDSRLHYTGTLNNTHMSGTTQWSLDLGPPYGVVNMNGSWTVTLQ